jgi:serine O-acetyltransferase
MSRFPQIFYIFRSIFFAGMPFHRYCVLRILVRGSGWNYHTYVFMDTDFLYQLFAAHSEAHRIPSPKLVCNWLDGLLGLLFPELADHRFKNLREFEQASSNSRLELYSILSTLSEDLPAPPNDLEERLMAQLPAIHALLCEDAEAILAGDPAAVSRTEVIRTYPGFYAIAVYRLAHAFHHLEVPLIPRVLAEHAHTRTGVDIHPAATIGHRFCIDHGTGIVIGETTRIGDDVKIYQNVTLGALSVKKEMAKTKRHPTIEDGVVIYAGTTILGGDTVIGRESIIGGNNWIVESVPPRSRIYFRKATVVQ